MFDQLFARDEYVARVARVRGEMARPGLDGMLLTSGPNLTYLSGYPSPLRSGSRPFIFLLPLSGAPILIVHTGRELEARGYSWVEEIRTYHRLSRAPLAEIIEAFEDAGLVQGRVGCELGGEQALDLPVCDFLELRERLSGVRFADGSRASTARRGEVPRPGGLRPARSRDLGRHRQLCHRR